MKKFSPSIFGLILICFFLPFVTVSCNGRENATLTQWNLITGTQYNSSNPIAVITLLIVLAGAGFGFMKGRVGLILSAAAGAAGFVATLALKFVIDNEIAKQGAKASYRAGFYLMLFLFIAAAGFNLYQMINRGKPIPLISSNIGGRGGGDSEFCAQCGARNSAGNEFCVECGAKLT